MEVFDIFLSHNSADKPAVEEIGQKLKAAGLRPWLDKWESIAGTRWRGALADGLRACPTCGVFIGPNGFNDWNRKDLDVAQNRAAKEPNFRLIPILLPGLLDPFCGHQERSQLLKISPALARSRSTPFVGLWKRR